MNDSISKPVLTNLVISTIVVIAVAWAMTTSMKASAEPLVLDLSKMTGSPVAMDAEPITNKLVLVAALDLCSTNIANRLSVDGVVSQLREQGDMTTLVKKLVESGDVCAIIGHKWEYGCGKPGCLVIHNAPTRHCVICNKVQTQEVSEWK